MTLSSEKLQFASSKLSLLKQEISKVIVGQDDVIRELLTTLIARGHALLEGVPGVGKTLLVNTLSKCLGLKFSRIQFTPDLMPADILGTILLFEDTSRKRYFEFQKGPIFANVILADEINRATPKTQSALLEAMQEKTVTISGTTYKLEEPFLVVATQNPIEMEGTYPLPEAQLDRFFFKIKIGYPSREELVDIVERTTKTTMVEPKIVIERKELMEVMELASEIPIADVVVNYAISIVEATHPEQKGATEMVRKYVRYGASPRAAQSLVVGSKITALMRNRANVDFQDIRDVALASLRHRLILNFEAEADGISSDYIIQDIIAKVPEYKRTSSLIEI